MARGRQRGRAEAAGAMPADLPLSTEPQAVDETAADATAPVEAEPVDDANDAPADVAEPDATDEQPEPAVYRDGRDPRVIALGNEAMHRHYTLGESHESVDAWYAGQLAAIGIGVEPSAVESARPAPVAAPRLAAPVLYYLRRRVIGNVSALGYDAYDSRHREWWVDGDIGDFKQAVIDSAPGCFSEDLTPRR